MELGEKLRQARLESGLSQKALCGSEITRNMLSLIENGSAKPSMKTLGYLASRLGKPVAYFLGEEITASPNRQVMADARAAFDAGSWEQVLEVLGDYRAPDADYDREKALITALSLLKLAQAALAQHREPYARELLGRCDTDIPYCPEALLRQKLLLLGQLGEKAASRLPSLDQELMLRSREALEAGDPGRAAALLEAVEEKTPRWFLLRGRACQAQGQYVQAVQAYTMAESTYPKETVPQLEACFRELGNYEKAYLYACKGRT